MPKITAPSVAQHRERQRAALVQQAESILLNEGASAVTAASVGKAVGLARSSVYEYFPSAGDLLAEVARQSIQQWSEELNVTIAPTPAGWPQLDAYVRATLRMVEEGKHEIADRLNGVDFTEEQRRRFMEPHDRLASPLPGVMQDIGVDDPELAAALVQGVVDAAIRRVGRNGDADGACTSIMALLRSGLVSTS